MHKAQILQRFCNGCCPWALWEGCAPRHTTSGDRPQLWCAVESAWACPLPTRVWFVFVFWFFNYLHEGRGFTVLAITALSLSSACINGAEAPFFMTATTIGEAAPGTAGGIPNLMGNIGGELSIWPVPHMAAAWGWNGTLAFWSAACVLAALLRLTVRVNDSGTA